MTRKPLKKHEHQTQESRLTCRSGPKLSLSPTHTPMHTHTHTHSRLTFHSYTESHPKTTISLVLYLTLFLSRSSSLPLNLTHARTNTPSPVCTTHIQTLTPFLNCAVMISVWSYATHKFCSLSSFLLLKYGYRCYKSDL